MAFIIAAKIVVATHIGFVVFLFFGGRLFANHPWLAWIHGACIAYGISITVIDWTCPLTLLEQWLLAQGGAPVYEGEFLPYYVWSHFGLTGSEIPVAAGLIVAIVAANVRPYRALFKAPSTTTR